VREKDQPVGLEPDRCGGRRIELHDRPSKIAALQRVSGEKHADASSPGGDQHRLRADRFQNVEPLITFVRFQSVGGSGELRVEVGGDRPQLDIGAQETGPDDETEGERDEKAPQSSRAYIGKREGEGKSRSRAGPGHRRGSQIPSASARPSARIRTNSS
jgi:hypothetical protein